MEHKFSLGQVVATPGVLEAVGHWPLEELARHQSGDWGNLDEEDKQSNEDALKYDGRLLSAYDVNDVHIWIITEADRSVTTVLLPSEY